MNPRHKKVFTFALAGLVSVVIFVALFAWSLLNFASAKANAFIYTEVFARPFDRALWLRACTDKPSGSVRLQMVDDLVRNHTLVGKSDADVVSLLGGATVHGAMNSNPCLDKNAWTYWLSPEDFVSDEFWLTLKRTGGKVTGVAVWRK